MGNEVSSSESNAATAAYSETPASAAAAAAYGDTQQWADAKLKLYNRFGRIFPANNTNNNTTNNTNNTTILENNAQYENNLSDQLQVLLMDIVQQMSRDEARIKQLEQMVPFLQTTLDQRVEEAVQKAVDTTVQQYVQIAVQTALLQQQQQQIAQQPGAPPAQESAAISANNLAAINSSLQQVIAVQNQDGLDIDTLKTESQAFAQNLATAQTTLLQELDDQRQQLAQTRQQLAQTQQQLAQLNSAQAQLITDITSYQQESKEVKATTLAMSSTQIDTDRNLSALQQVVENYISSVQQLGTVQQQNGADISVLKATVSELSTLQQPSQSDIDSIRVATANNTQVVSALKDSLQQVIDVQNQDGSDISALTAAREELTNSVAALTQQSTVQAQNLSTLQALAGTLEQNLRELQSTRQQTSQSAQNSAESTAQDVASLTSTVQNLASNTRATTDQILSTVQQQQSDIQSIVSSFQRLDAAQTASDSDVQALKSSVQRLDAAQTASDRNVQQLSSELAITKTDVEALNSNLQIVNANITSVQQSLQDSLAGLQNQTTQSIQSLNSAQTGANREIVLLKTSTQTLTTSVSSLFASIGTLTSRADASVVSISQLERTIPLLAVVPTGTLICFSSRSIPAGYLYCNGQDVSRTTYSTLFALMGTVFGAGNGSSTFNVPDLRGRFARGFDDGAGRDPNRIFGSFQNFDIQGHAHGVFGMVSTNEQKEINPNRYGVGSMRTDGAQVVWAHDYTAVTGSYETRPMNICFVWVVKT